MWVGMRRGKWVLGILGKRMITIERIRGLHRRERRVVLEIWRGRVRRGGGYIWVGRGVGALLGEPRE